MAYDGIVTRAVVYEMREKTVQGKIEKVYQPESDELVFIIHSKSGKYKLLASCNPSHARVHFIDESPVNPPAPYAFCMLLRKHLQGARITEVDQNESERIIEITMETLNELGFTVSRKLIFEIMGKHSNIILVDLSTGKIIDSIKRISFDVNRVRQILPGMIYEYPPKQDKVPFTEVGEEQLNEIRDAFSDRDQRAKKYLGTVGGISPAFAREMAAKKEPYLFLRDTLHNIENGKPKSFVYFEKKGAVNPLEYHITELEEYRNSVEELSFDTVSAGLEYFFNKKESSNQGKQKSHDLIRSVTANLDKMYLKKKRLSEDILEAEDSEHLRLYGELLTANMHLIKAGMKKVDVINYYDGSTVTVPLDVKLSPSKNAQHYFKKYGKAKTAIKEKQIQLEENEREISYLESVLAFLENTDSVEEIESLRQELVETGYVRKRKQQGGYKEKKYRPEPYKYILKNGMTVLAGRNNKENDILTLKTASKSDLWMHTKDIPGSHVILMTGGINVDDLDAETIYEAASVAAFHSKARTSENVPVDYVPVRFVKKPQGAKPGMVIFTNNRTVWVDPKLPTEEKDGKK